MTTDRRSLAAAMAVVFLIAAAAAALGIGVPSTYGAQAAVDEPQYLLSALSLWEDHDLDISDELAERRWTEFHTAELPVQTAVGDGGKQVSPHDPLLPVLLAVPMGVGGWAAAKATLAMLAGVTAVLALWVAVRRFAVPVRLAAIGVGAAFASPPLAVYGQQVYPEMPAALVVLAGVGALTGSDLRGHRLAAWLSAVILLPWLSVKYAPVAAAMALAGIVRQVQSARTCGRLGLSVTGSVLALAVIARRARGAWAVGRSLAATASVMALAAIAYLVAHRWIWGGWTVYASGDHFEQSGEFGVVGYAPDYAGRSLRLVGLLVDRGFGIAAWQPAWLLGLVAVGALARRRPPGSLALGLPLAAGYATATWIALTMHGFWWPGRQLVVVLPLLLIGILWWLAAVAKTWVKVLAAVLAATGIVSFVALLRDGYAGSITWVVDFEQVRNPLSSALRPLLPDYRGDQFLVPHLLWVLALGGLVLAGWLSARPRNTDPEIPTSVRFRPKEEAIT